MKPTPNAAANVTRLICVYTYDVDDERDCCSVCHTLRNLGVTWSILCEADAGKYFKNGVRVSKRYE
jgi:hypothetical protein